jgi:hypothetical protein
MVLLVKNRDFFGYSRQPWWIMITLRQCCCKPCFISPKAKWTGTFFRSFCAKLFLKLQGRGRMNHRIVEPQ